MTTQVYASAELVNRSWVYVTANYNTLINDEVFSYFMLINLWGPGQCVTILGLIANILNVITFVRQGLKDSVNISLLGLTISDLGSLVFLFFINLCWTPAIIHLDLPFYPTQLMYFMFYVHVLFTRVTTGTTAWIAMERCLCIIAPLKVKSIITPKRTARYIYALYLIATASILPMFYTSRVKWMFDSRRNKSVLGMAKIANRERIDGVVYWINNILPLMFFIFIIVCTIVLIKALQKNAKWRQQSATKKEMATSRDTKVVKLVLVISLVFILCYAPGAVFFLWVVFDKDMKIDGKQKNFLVAFFSLLLHLESINATANFFVYINMSSKFKATFRQIIHLDKQKSSLQEEIRLNTTD